MKILVMIMLGIFRNDNLVQTGLKLCKICDKVYLREGNSIYIRDKYSPLLLYGL